MPDPHRFLKVFLCHASQDKPVVRVLAQRLYAERWIDPWVDEKKLLPGQDWRAKIEEAVETSDVVIICLSTNSVTKEGHVQKEIRYAREIAFEKPDETIFLIPLRLDECTVPRGLRFYQWADYFGEKKDETYSALIESLRLRHEQKIILEERQRKQKEQLEREIAEKIAWEKAEREANEKAAREKEKHERSERAEQEKLKLEATERVRREEAERKAADKAARKKARHDAFEKAKREWAEHLAARIIALKETLSKSYASLKSTLPKVVPFLRIAGFASIVIMLVWFGPWAMTKLASLVPTARPDEVPTLHPRATLTLTLSPLPSTQILTPTSTPTLSPTAIGGGAGKIAFVSDRDGVPEIYVINSDGNGLLKLANSITPKFSPAWSPDGKKIAFVSNTNKPGNLYIMNADGSSHIQLITTEGLISDNPAWSPDGKKIAFVGWGLHRYSDLYVINADGSHLVSASDHPTGLWSWDWAPDSQKIAFSPGPCAGLSGVCVMNADRSNFINLADKSGYGGSDRDPSWSPDGEKIAFTSGRYGNAEVFVMNADGTNQVNLTHYGKAWDGSPTWSPDGKKIVFSSYRDGNYEIYVMNADGTDVMNLTNNPADDGGAIWSPDSTKIAFVSWRDGNSEIYVINVDGTKLIKLTNNAANDDSPVWSP